MLKKRIIPVQLLLGDRLIKTVGFDTWRDVGDPVKSSKVYNDQDADELVFLDIDRSARSPDRLLRLLERVSEVCFMPLSVGGGISTFDDAARLIQGGADKIVVNSILYRDPSLASRIAGGFGRQAVIASIDVRREGNGWSCWSDCGRQREDISLDVHVERVVAAGAGEVLINAIDRDGMRQGYDLALLSHVSSLVDVPVIGCGGSGTYEHLREAFEVTGVDALACGSLFNFGDNNPIRAKAHLTNAGLPMKVL